MQIINRQFEQVFATQVQKIDNENKEGAESTGEIFNVIKVNL